MITLLITFCLAGQPDRCVVRSDFERPSSIQECLLAGQQTGAAWVVEHPAYEMRAVRCRMGVPTRDL